MCVYCTMRMDKIRKANIIVFRATLICTVFSTLWMVDGEESVHFMMNDMVRIVAKCDITI